MRPLAIVGGLLGTFLLVALGCVLILGRLAGAGKQFARDFKQSPFAPNPAAYSKSYRPPAEFHTNLGRLSVMSAEDHSDEKQALGVIEKELENYSQAPVMEVKWIRVAPGSLDTECDFIYFRDAMKVSYSIGSQTPLGCGGVKAMDILGMAHSAKAGIAENIGILSKRK